jgi:TonB family protein
MTKIFLFFGILTSFLALPSEVFGQRERVESNVHRHSTENLRKCRDLKLGSITLMPSPAYPSQARAEKVGGTVEVSVKIDEKGNVFEIENVSGNKILQNAAIEAARKAKFNPTFCDGQPAQISRILVYNFIPLPPGERYFTPEKIEDLTDISRTSQFYEAILDLTENYRIAFGYGNRRFYPETPLTRGDFAHFLRLTLDLIQKRAEISRINPRQIGLMNRFNPQNLTSLDEIKDINPQDPFFDSVKALLLTYDIALFNEKLEFKGRNPMTQKEVIEYWRIFFGEESVPVNFLNAESEEKFVTRGEFALFLQESLQILTYKLLP